MLQRRLLLRPALSRVHCLNLTSTARRRPRAKAVAACLTPAPESSPATSVSLLMFHGPGSRSIFTTAAAIASAYCAVALGSGPSVSHLAFDSPATTTSGDRPRAGSFTSSSKAHSANSGSGSGSSAASNGSAPSSSVSSFTRSTSNPTASSSSIPRRTYTTSVVAFKGQRSYMEDDFFVSKDGAFAAVYDGHGGAAVSKFLRQNLFAQIPTQQFFTDDLGMPVTMTPDFQTLGCTMTFGQSPLPLDEDPVSTEKCFASCPTAQLKTPVCPKVGIINR